MKFTSFKEFKASVGVTTQKIADYIQEDLAVTLRDLRTGLTQLSFLDNFRSFEVTVTIAAGEELAIRNQFRDGTIPTRRIVVRANDYTLTDGATAWSKEFVYLKNSGSGSLTATVVFLK